MKNRDFMLAGSVLLSLGLATQVQAQNKDQLFFYGFEDNLSSFTDSSKPLDSIMHLRYYTAESDGNGSKDPDKWTLDPVVYDTALYLLNGVQTCQQNDASVRANDSYDCQYDGTDLHQKEMEALGAEGGNYYLHYQSDKYIGTSTTSTASADYQGCLFIRNIPIEDSTSYRLVYYRKTDQPDKAQMYSGIFRGFYNSEKSLSLDGASGNEFMVNNTSGISSSWERVTVMAYYTNDSVANRHCYQAGYWWSSSWNRMGADGKERVYIEQPDKFFVRLTFSGSEADYYIDDIALYKSWIGGAEYNGDKIRVNFGYQTNLADLAKASPLESIELPSQYFTITGIDPESNERVSIPVTSAEYHTDGYMYIFLAPYEYEGEYYDQDVSYYGDIRISFTNPVNDPKMALKYTGSLYPMGTDTIWAKTKIVPNFSNEFVLPNASVSATPIAKLAPTAMKMEPSDGSLKLPANTTSIKVYFNKPVYVEDSKATTKGVKAIFTKNSSGAQEGWFASEFNNADSTVVFTRDSSDPLTGDYVIQIIQARAGASFNAAPVKTFGLTFGTEMNKPIRMAKDDFQSLPNNGLPSGFTTTECTISNSKCRVVDFKGNYNKGFIWGLFKSGNSKPSIEYAFNVTAANTYKVSFGLSGYNCTCKWNTTPRTTFVILDQDKDTVMKQVDCTPSKTNVYSIGDAVNSINQYEYSVNFSQEGTYYLKWTQPDETAYGQNDNSTIMYYFEVSNDYSSAYKYVEKVDNAYAAAIAVKANAESDVKFSGSVLNSLKTVITTYTGFNEADPPYTDPAQYNDAASKLDAATNTMSVRIDSVNLYYKEYKDCDSLIQLYQDTANVPAVIAAKALLAENAELVMPNTEAPTLRIIIKSIQDASAAIKNRISKNNTFYTTKNNVVNTLDVKMTYKFFEEYAALQVAYNENKDQDIVGGTDAEVQAAIDAMQSALNTFNGKLDGALGMAKQAKLLYEAALALGVDFNVLNPGSSEKLEEIITKLDNDNADLVEALKLAVKAKMYNMIANSEELPVDLDLSGFITNPGLYCQAVVDVVEYYSYQWGEPKDRWKLKKGTYTDVYPGWTFYSNGGNVHVGYEGRNWTNASPVFDGYVAADWSSAFNMNQTVEDLPLGSYSIGLVFTNSVSNASSNFIVSTPGQDTVYNDTVLVVASSQDYTETPNIFTNNDIAVTQGTVTMKVNHPDLNGWARVDNFTMLYKAAIETGVDYAALATQLNTAAATAISEVVTGVESVTVSGSSVEYYNLNGIRLAAPQKGINIKVTTGANGKRVSEKILVK